MRHRIIAAAIALVFGLSMPRAVAAKGHGGGHSSGGHSSGGHSSGGHASGGHSSGGHASAGHSSGGHMASGGQKSGGRTPATTRGAAAPPPVATSQPRGSSRTPDPLAIVGTAVPRSSSPRQVVVIAPSFYTPHVFRPRFTGLGFNFGIRHLGYGYGPAYYGLGYDYPLWCETTINCDVVPMTGVVEMPPPYDTASPMPYELPPAAPPPYEQSPADAGSGTVRLDVQPVTAQIFVDGEYVGTVEDFRSGAGLVVAEGIHRVEFRATGYAPAVVDMRIAAGRRITYRATLKPEAQ